MNNIIKSLNLNEGAVLTLEKLQERMEFEAFSGFSAAQPYSAENPLCGIYDECAMKEPCPIFYGCLCDCPEVSYTVCECDGPGDYQPCHPYKD